MNVVSAGSPGLAANLKCFLSAVGFTAPSHTKNVGRTLLRINNRSVCAFPKAGCGTKQSHHRRQISMRIAETDAILPEADTLILTSYVPAFIYPPMLRQLMWISIENFHFVSIREPCAIVFRHIIYRMPIPFAYKPYLLETKATVNERAVIFTKRFTCLIYIPISRSGFADMKNLRWMRSILLHKPYHLAAMSGNLSLISVGHRPS